MAVAIEMMFSGATLEQYDEILVKMGLTPGGATPPGAIFHWAAMSDKGLHVVDVWETKERFEQFAQEQIGPFSREVGIEDQPEMRFYEIHSYLAASS